MSNRVQLASLVEEIEQNLFKIEQKFWVGKVKFGKLGEILGEFPLIIICILSENPEKPKPEKPLLWALRSHRAFMPSVTQGTTELRNYGITESRKYGVTEIRNYGSTTCGITEALRVELRI